MYHEHFGLHQAPFRITPQTEYFYSGAQRGPLLEALLFAITHDEGIIRISGEVGTGKTMLCRMLIERLPPEVMVVYIANPSLTPAELIATVAHELGVVPEDGHSLLRLIERRLIALYAEGRRVLAIIDEAHAMPRESLDQIRLLSNLETSTRKLLQIVLFGQPELDAILEERPMRSLRERITQNFFLSPLDHQQVRDYLHFRLRTAGYKGPDLFNNKALSLITRASKGLTRRVNILADKTLLAAFADNTHTITDRHVTAAIRDADYSLSPLPSRLNLFIAGGLALFGTAALLAWQFLPGLPNQPSPSAPSSALVDVASAPVATPPPAPTAATRPVAPPVASAASTPATNAENAPPAGQLDWAPIPEQLGPLARERLLASRADMANIADTHWFLQLRSIPASNAPSLEGFLTSADKAVDPAQLRLFVVKDDPRQTIGIIYGNYPDSRTAYAELARLPTWIRGIGAFARPYKSLRAEKPRPAVPAPVARPAA